MLESSTWHLMLFLGRRVGLLVCKSLGCRFERAFDSLFSFEVLGGPAAHCIRALGYKGFMAPYD